MPEPIENSKPIATTKEHCPECNDERNCSKFAHVNIPWHWEDKYEGFSVSGAVLHTLHQCLGCETVFYVQESWDDQDIDQWYDADGNTRAEAVKTKVSYPKPVGRRPEWLGALGKKDDELKEVLEELYIAADANCLTLASIGIRTAIDRATELLKIDPAMSFNEKLSELKTGGWIGETEHNVLSVVTDAGSAAAHRGWRPDEASFGKLIMALEMFLQRAILFGKDALDVKKSIPSRPKRKNK